MTTTEEQTELQLEPLSTYLTALGKSEATRHLTGLTCHCEGTAYLPLTGHPVNTPGCTSTVKPRTYPSWAERSNLHLPSSDMAASIYAELAKHAPTKGQRKRFRQRAAIHRTASDAIKRNTIYEAERR